MATSSSKQKLVLALGDSHTFGQIGSAWLAKAAQEHPSLRFVNAGVCAALTREALRAMGWMRRTNQHNALSKPQA